MNSHDIDPSEHSPSIRATGGQLRQLDQSMAARLAEQIELSIRIAADDDDTTLIVQAKSQPGKVQLETRGEQVRSALALPQGSVAVWECESGHAKRIANHAAAVLQLAITKHENNQLLSEVQSLTNQVMQDFEELSLIRTLASSLELPQSTNDIDTFVVSSLLPLVSGVGAESIAAVLTDDNQMRAPLWTGKKLLSNEATWNLIERLRDEAASRPVVRNHDIGCDPDCDDLVHEIMLVECASEARKHGWILSCNRMRDEKDDLPWAQLGFTTVQASLMETVTNQLASQLNNIRLLRQKEELFTDVIRALVNAVEARDPYTCGHSERVASFARLIAAKIGFSPSECERIYLTGLLHDVGKIAIPDGVLQKPNSLNPEEREIIETHTDFGWRILHELEALQDILPGVLYHHEHWDGGGYPDRLVGENIPIDGRVLAVCDAFDAMTSDRPYRRGMSVEKAIGILQGGAGQFWDPHLVNVFAQHLDEIDHVRRSHRPRVPITRPAPIDGQPVIGIAGVSVSSIANLSE
ncbi:HD-GYP domain-containing protein [Roseiconus lacunae]|uniref:HD-GYP domain-containing protein n=1 Tax=Roseiconus lacunae TaxID=2605694 RepID=UPI0030869ECA|nr:HD-GYP domain-containing protein [Stieleria sp. HD01]